MKNWGERMNLPVIVIGGGGHAKVLIDTLRLLEKEIIGVTVLDAKKEKSSILGVPILGEDCEVFRFSPLKVQLINGIGSISSTEKRKTLYERFKKSGYKFATVIHPSAVVASDVQLLEGAQIMAGSVIQTGSIVGANSIVNTHTSIDHDCRIGDHVHIAPGVILSGSVLIGNGAHIGTGAKAIQGVQIGKNCLIGAGSLIIKNIPNDTKAFGVPAKVLSNK